jgi:quinoprotein glucose dehydrogenase
VSPIGRYGRIFIGMLTTANLVLAGEGATHAKNGETVALLRAYDKDTGEDVADRVGMPARQTGSPMTFMNNGKQHIVLAVSHLGGELIVYALP